MSDPIIYGRAITRQFILGDDVVRALDGVDITVQTGEFLGITGSSGSGKSTLLYVLSGMDRPSSGEIWVQGKNIALLDENELASYRRQDVGFVFQGFNLISSMTAQQNVELPMIFAGVPARERQQRAQALLDQVGLAHRFAHKPGQMSGGQQQRVAIARALVNNPPIIFADEPTGNLDSKSGLDVMQVLQGLHAQGRTVLLVSHDAAVIAFASRVMRLKDGKVVEEGERRKDEG
ncbi:MAG: ABC transporter ATP-binding protein [Chloroflexota bacterium]|jgi:ABC-type lipoprotein export system ATPase subunit